MASPTNHKDLVCFPCSQKGGCKTHRVEADGRSCSICGEAPQGLWTKDELDIVEKDTHGPSTFAEVPSPVPKGCYAGASPEHRVTGTLLFGNSLDSGCQDLKSDTEIELTVLNFAGCCMATVTCSSEDTVAAVKRRVSRSSGVPVAEQRLVFKDAVLQDRNTLQQAGMVADAENKSDSFTQHEESLKLTVYCVRTRPSGVARHLEAQATSQEPEEAACAAVADVVDSMMQMEHGLSERVKPVVAHLKGAMDARHRQELVAWMVQAFEALRFDDNMLHSVCLTVDRYYACREEPAQTTSMQRVLLSAVSTEMKLACEDDFPKGHWQRVLLHLGAGRVSLQSILRTEYDLLARLEFVVGVPTPLTFLRELALRLQHSPQAAKLLNLATFLLELALLDPELEYGRYPHAVLAAGALSASLRTLNAPNEQREEVLEDLGTYCPSLGNVNDMVYECEESLLELWLACTEHYGEMAEFYRHVEAKFSCHLRHNVASLSPMDGLARVREERPSGKPLPQRGNCQQTPVELDFSDFTAQGYDSDVKSTIIRNTI